MSETAKKRGGTKHYGAYPDGERHPLLAYAFRPFFLLLPAYMALSIVLWGLLWTGKLNLEFMGNPLAWHIYEMLFGVASAGIAGFILTAVPEFYEGVRPVTGRLLLGILLLWAAGRLAFWFMEQVGIPVVALTNLPFLLWITWLVGRPIVTDPLRRHFGLAFSFIGILLIQSWYFAALLQWVDMDPMSILKAGVGAFMVLVLLALRRINTGAINQWLEEQGIDDTYLARPPRYNIAILSVILFSIVELLLPGNPVLGWLGLAAAAALFNTLNDFFLEETSIVFKPYVLPLFLILVLMAAGYGLMGIDYLNDDFYGINHFRHLLTSGVLGLSFLVVMTIVGTVHTGRRLAANQWIDVGVALVLLATALRTAIAFMPEQGHWLYLASALLWAAPFLIYLWVFFPTLTRPRVDGLPG